MQSARAGPGGFTSTAGANLIAARRAREDLIAALEAGRVPASPRLRFDTVGGWWRERFEAKVLAGERHPRTLEAHCYQLDKNLLPTLASRRIGALGADDVAALLGDLRANGRSAKTAANALATLHSILRYARRHGWVTVDPVDLLEPEERPRPQRRRQRVLGRGEIERLLDACPSRGRILVETALFSGLRISELLGLVWDDVDFHRGVIAVRFQLSRAHRDEPARRVATKTPASVRQVPLIEQLSRLLTAHKQASSFAAPSDWVLRPPAAPRMDSATSPSACSGGQPTRPA
jgi:integrase